MDQRNDIVKPHIGCLLYRKDNVSGKIDQLVTVATQTKKRGKNNGLIDKATLCHVVKVDGSNVYYNNKQPQCYLSLNNHGSWFSKSTLQRYNYSWDNNQWISDTKPAPLPAHAMVVPIVTLPILKLTKMLSPSQ